MVRRSRQAQRASLWAFNPLSCKINIWEWKFWKKHSLLLETEVFQLCQQVEQVRTTSFMPEKQNKSRDWVKKTTSVLNIECRMYDLSVVPKEMYRACFVLAKLGVWQTLFVNLDMYRCMWCSSYGLKRLVFLCKQLPPWLTSWLLSNVRTVRHRHWG